MASKSAKEEELDDFARMQRKFYGLDQPGIEKPIKISSKVETPKKEAKKSQDYKCHVPDEPPIAKSPADLRKLMEKVEREASAKKNGSI